jgi:hypothetical protein
VKLTAQEGSPFTSEEFVKRCFKSMVEELFPEKKERCVSDGLSACTVTRRTEDLGDSTFSCLKKQMSVFHYIFFSS